MNMYKKQLTKRIIFTFLTLLWIGFIFSRSLMPGDRSGDESGKLLNFLNSITSSLGIGEIFTHLFVRKCAHFTEFALLSVLAFITYKAYSFNLKITFTLTAVTYSIVAICDECIQLFTPDRAGKFTDVLIDISGGTAVLLIFAFVYILKHFRCKKSKSSI